MPGGCGSRPRDWGRPRPQQGRSRPALSILHRATRRSAGRQCSHQRQRAAQAGGLGVRKQGGGVRLVGRHPRRPPHLPRDGSYLWPEALASPKGGTSPKQGPLRRFRGLYTSAWARVGHVLHRTDGFSLGESGRTWPAPFPRTQRCSESGCPRAEHASCIPQGERWRPLSPGLGRPYSTSLACPNPPLSALWESSTDTKAPFWRGFPFG